MFYSRLNVVEIWSGRIHLTVHRMSTFVILISCMSSCKTTVIVVDVGVSTSVINMILLGLRVCNKV
jgi:hypothetical protein